MCSSDLTKLSDEYELDRGSISKIERGLYSIEFITAWQIVETLGIDFSEFASLLKEYLGDDFTLIDE